MAAAITAVPFVGRERELRRLAGCLELATAAQGGVVLLTGEPGIGKTRTAEEFAAIAESRGARVLWGRCLEGEGAPAFWPWIQILRAYARDREPEALRVALGSGIDDLAQLAPLLREHLPEFAASTVPTPDPSRFRLFDAYATFLFTVAAERPLVLVLDDLHQADAPSLRLLEWVARELDAARQTHGGARLLIVAAYRDTEAGDDRPLFTILAELARLPRSERIELTGLTEAEVARAITLSAEGAPDAPLASAVYATTEGNPFFLVEVLRLLATEGVLDGARVPAGVRVPPTVRATIGRRLERLSPEGRRLLAVASVEGRDFGLGLLGRVIGLEAGRLLDLTAEAEEARVIALVPETLDRYRFTHALIRETLYAGLPHATRLRLHGQVGEALESLTATDPAPPHAELAHHFLRAAVLDPARAVRHAHLAGDHALATLAYEEAAHYYDAALQALTLAEPSDPSAQAEQQFELLLAQAQARHLAGSFEAAQQSVVQAATIARRLRSPTHLARAALSPGPAPANVGLVEPATIALLEEALAWLSEDDSPERARVMAALAKALYSVTDAGDRRTTLCIAAITMARRLRDPIVLAEVLTLAYWSLPAPEEQEARLAIADELVDLAATIVNLELAFHGHGERLIEHLALGDIAALDRDLTEAGRLAVAMRQAYYTVSVRGFRAVRATLGGHLAEARRLSAHITSDAQRMQSAVVTFGAVMLRLPLDLEQDRAGDLLTAIESVGGQLGASYDLALRCAGIFVRSRLRGDAEVDVELERLSATGFRDLPRDQFMLFNIACLAEVCAARSDRERAVALYERLLPFADRTASAWSVVCLGAAARFLGLLATTLGRWDQAAAHFEHALAKNAAMGARPFLAQTQHDYASMLLSRVSLDGERMTKAGAAQSLARASDLLTEAHATASELGMTRLTAVTEHRLRAISTEPSRRNAAASPFPNGLTPREIEVLCLLARRASNNEIAADLVLSVRTVERHVANIYAKTGLHDRREARAYAIDHGMLRPD